LDSIKKIALALPELRLVSGYDHPDRYTRTDDIDYKVQIKYIDSTNQHWRTSESTGHTYAIQRELLNEFKHIFLQHEHLINDRDLWRHLHGIGVPLWTAIPGFTTQVDNFLSPTINWEDYSAKIDKKINVFGGKGFVGSKYCELTPNVINNDRNNYTVSTETNDVVYFISTVDNYNIHIDPYLDINTNLTTLIKVLETCKENKEITFNFISSWFVYGNVPLPAKESSLCDPKGFYSITKRAAEQMLISYCETYGLKYRILRLCNVLGKDDNKVSKKKNALQYMISEILENRDVNLYDNGMVYRDYMHVDDVVNAINLVITKGELNQIYNIGSGIPTYIRHAMEYALQASGSTSFLNSIPPAPFHDIVQTKNMVMDNTKLKELGFTPKYNLYQTIDSLLYK
jgi:nucleoside-diphosphate-sugar epimerase